MDPRIFFYFLIAAGLIAAVAIDRICSKLPISLPIIYTAIGFAVFSLPLGLPTLDPIGIPPHAEAAEYLTEFIVVVSLMGAGIAIDRPFSWNGWSQVWPLLIILMPLTILAVALLGWGWLGLTPAAAILLGAALSPTDPVLADAVQVGPPGDNERDDVRFGLTVEAGLNDGLAFPFTYLALAAIGMTSIGSWTWEWLAEDLLWRTIAGCVVGYAVGRAGAWYVFDRSPEGETDPASGPIHTSEGLIVLGTLLASYSIAEFVHGYGFLAVFVAAVTARQSETQSRYHAISHHFIRQIERIVLIIMLFGLGGLLASGILDALTWTGAAMAFLLTSVIRPVFGMLAQLFCRLPFSGRLAVSFFGVRGIGSIYYLAYAQNHGMFDGIEQLWAIAVFTILLSIVVHGMSAGAFLHSVRKRGGHKLADLNEGSTG